MRPSRSWREGRWDLVDDIDDIIVVDDVHFPYAMPADATRYRFSTYRAPCPSPLSVMGISAASLLARLTAHLRLRMRPNLQYEGCCCDGGVDDKPRMRDLQFLAFASSVPGPVQIPNFGHADDNLSETRESLA